MANRLSGPEQSPKIRETLQSVLHSLDEAQMHVPAIHVHMALLALGIEPAYQPRHAVMTEVT